MEWREEEQDRDYEDQGNLNIVYSNFLKYAREIGSAPSIEEFAYYLKDTTRPHYEHMNEKLINSYLQYFNYRQDLPLELSETQDSQTVYFWGKPKPDIVPFFYLSQISLLFIIHHGQLQLKEEKGKVDYQQFPCPFDELKRLILAAQECSSTGGTKLEMRMLRELFLSRNWCDLDERRVRLIEDIYKEYTPFQRGPTKSEGEFEYLVTRRGEPVILKEWCTNNVLYALSSNQDLNGVYFACGTTIIVPPLSTGQSYNFERVNPAYFRIHDERHHGEQKGVQNGDLLLFYPKLSNITECPIFFQFLEDFNRQNRLPPPELRPQTVFDPTLGDAGKGGLKEIITEITSFSLYTYLQSLSTLSVIDNSCEDHHWDFHEEDLKKELEDIGKKRNKDIERKIRELRKLREKKNKGLRGGIKTKRKRKTMKKKRKTMKKYK